MGCKMMERFFAKLKRQEIDRQFAAIADDFEYQSLNQTMAGSFADSDWEAWVMAETLDNRTSGSRDADYVSNPLSHRKLTFCKAYCYTVHMNVEKQINYWRNSSREDWDVALELVASKHIRHGLFFAHLAIEKTMKALICQETKTFPPKSHNLLILARKANLELSDEHKRLVARFDRYQLEGRYPDSLAPAPDLEMASQELDAAKELLTWLAKRF